MKQNASILYEFRELFFPVGNPGSADPRRRPPIIPFFLPFAGCPHRCLFCAQDKQTGQRTKNSRNYPDELSRILSGLEARSGNRPAELAFYGGTFTALPLPLQEACLSLAQKAKKRGLVSYIRCSTRPDAVQPDHLGWLKNMGMDLVELGIQSFHEEPLHASQRGYSGEAAREGCRRVLASGLKLGIQLLPGMPGSTPAIFAEDVAESLAFSPACLRFYPCLVVDGTPLAEAWKAGLYTPWDVQTTVRTLGKALAAAWARRVPVIRLSLAPEAELDNAVLAGPRHPALGNLIQSEALLQTVRGRLHGEKAPPDALLLPRYCQGLFFGHGGNLLPAWNSLGITKKNVHWIQGESGCLRWNPPPASPSDPAGE